MKKVISFLVAGLMLFSVVFALAGCAGEGGENVTENKDNNTNILNNVKIEHLCTIAIEGKEFELPITLKELEELGLVQMNDYDNEQVRNAQNKRFGMIMNPRQDFSLIYSMEALDDPSKGAENVNVIGISTYRANKDQIALNGDVCTGITIDEAIESLGDDYNVVAALDSEDLYNGTVRINYTNDNEHIIVDAKNGIVTYIEYSSDWSVE
ncbi:MAG: hypothetical protein IJC90_07080 [Clostridia bacterium]|nr:hypothetical protein [Clostridia bacterium]